MEQKKEFKYFTIVEHEKEQNYLREKHKEGWKFLKVTGLGIYHFEKCEPQDVVYQLDYNQEGLAHKEEYLQMFKDCGWEYLMDFVGYSYFRKPAAEMKEDEGIFCDDESRLEMMNRVFKGKLLPLFVILCCIIIPQLISQLSLNTPSSNTIVAIYAFILILYLNIIVSFGIQYFNYRKKVRQ